MEELLIFVGKRKGNLSHCCIIHYSFLIVNY